MAGWWRRIYSVLTRDPLMTQGQQNTGRPVKSPVIADAERIHAIFLAACEKHAGVRLLGEEEQHVVHAVFHGYQVSDALVTISSTDPVFELARDRETLNMAFSDGVKNYLATVKTESNWQDALAYFWRFPLPDQLLSSEFRRYLRIYLADTHSQVRILDEQLREYRCQLRDFSERGFRLSADVSDEARFLALMDQDCVADLMIKDSQNFQVTARLRNRVVRGHILEMGFEIVDLPEPQANRLRKLVMAESAHKPHLR
jgi:hypothetical protein